MCCLAADRRDKFDIVRIELGRSRSDCLAGQGGILLEAWLHTEIRGWTLADVVDDEGFAALLHAARDQLADVADGTGVAFDVSALVVSGPPTD